jgi:hypothetical protein
MPAEARQPAPLPIDSDAGNHSNDFDERPQT